MRSPAGSTAIVVGAGVGGLSTACYLADAGVSVHVVEQNDQLGGRASRLERDGFRFDMGPSWYLMPDVFERFFAAFNRTPSEYYDLTHLNPHYRIFFKDGDQVDVTPDRGRTKDVFESYETGAGDALERYLETARHHYEIGMEHFVYEDRPRLRDYIDPNVAQHEAIRVQRVGWPAARRRRRRRFRLRAEKRRRGRGSRDELVAEGTWLRDRRFSRFVGGVPCWRRCVSGTFLLVSARRLAERWPSYYRIV
ncbi:phytoene desaturase [Natrialba taiwanensis DSM 12281]|uniref:Phytoene desaturase n=1 Tax=Natrialba taiwanensis DSM 12281 TaxID=1230458 RepID=M0AAZ5_9EURY|nr:phytoene desaturase [Natrialba taiwanensis DSM 12281]